LELGINIYGILAVAGVSSVADVLLTAWHTRGIRDAAYVPFFFKTLAYEKNK
jgi:hypothetical protein